MSEKEGFHELKVSPEAEIKVLRAFLKEDQALISSLQSENERLRKDYSELQAHKDKKIKYWVEKNDELKDEIKRLKSSVSEKGKINASLNEHNQELNNKIRDLLLQIKAQDFWENEHDKLKKLVDTKASSTTGEELKSFSVSNEGVRG